MSTCSPESMALCHQIRPGWPRLTNGWEQPASAGRIGWLPSAPSRQNRTRHPPTVPPATQRWTRRCWRESTCRWIQRYRWDEHQNTKENTFWSASTSPSNPLLLVGVFLGDSAVGKQQHHQVGEQIQAILRVSPVTWLVMNHHHIVPRQLKVQTMFCQELPRNQPGPASKFPSTAPGISELKTKPSQSGTQITKDYMETWNKCW